MTVNISKPSINIREKLAELNKPSGIAGEAVLRADSVQEIRNSIGAGRKNLIINGGFDVWQRGTYTTATNVSSGVQSDRWKIAQSVTTGTIQDLGGSVRLEVTGAGTGTLRMYQPIEDKGLYKRISGKTLTFSAWVKSNTANARIECFKGNGVGWDGWDSAHTGGGAWEKLSATYVLADISSLTDGTFSVQVGLDGYNSADVALAVGDYCEIKDVQLELGSTATDFEHRSYGEELALCQRYYYAINGAGNAGYNMILQRRNGNGTKSYQQTIEFPVTMRVSPATAATYLDLHKPGVAYDPITSIGFASSPEMGAAHIMVQTANIDSIAAQVRNFNIQFDAEL